MAPSFAAVVLSGLEAPRKRIDANTSSGTAVFGKPYSEAVLSLSRLALFSGVPSCVGWSARTRSKVFGSPATGVSLTRPGN
mgnify:CR=1 FL=1